MAKIPLSRANHDYAGNQAIISLSGIRIIVQAVVEATAGASTAYEITDRATKRLICFHNSGVNTDIRVNQNAAATADHLPMASAVYMSFEVEFPPSGPADTVTFWNTSGAPIDIFVVEVV